MGSLFTKQARKMPDPPTKQARKMPDPPTKQARKMLDPPQKNTIIDSPSYILGKNTSTPKKTSHYRPTESFDTNRLNFIPDSKQSWNSHLPKTRPLIQRPNSICDFPNSILQFEHRNQLINMPTHQKYKCDQCGMVFPSNDALFRHKTRFCIGVKDSGIGRKPVYSDDEESDDRNNSKRSTVKKVVRHHSPVRHLSPIRHHSPTEKVIRHHSPIEKKREEVNEWKRQRSILQTVEDMEDRILLDTQKTQRHSHHIKKQDNIYNEILLEYERLQNQEREVLRQMYNLQSEPIASTNSSEKVKPMNNVTDYSKIQFEDLHRRNVRLERERRIIQQKLEELISTNYQPSTISNYEPYKFLHEMKEQQELNEKALDFLRGRLIYPESSSFTTLSDVPSLPPINTGYTRLRRTGGNNVRSFRNSYLQSGGHDANVIARYSDLEYRLRAYENDPWTKDYPEPLKRSQYQTDRPIDTTTARLKLANDENQRLQSELDEMHKKFETLDTRTTRLESSVVSNGMSNSIDHQRNFSSRIDQYPISQTSVRENNNDQFDQLQSSLNILDKRVTPRTSPAMSLLASNMNKLRDPLSPQSYDPIGGFVIFFDFIVNLPPTIEQCCLITCLHHPRSGLGEPSQLEPFKCEPYIDEKTGERICVALIATKQPVPRCPPQQALTVVLEIQTATGKQISNDDLQTNAWTKIPLFDNKNRLLSGRWKVPLKALPIRHEENLAVITTLPTYDRAELHYRLVNSQDGDDQSIAPLSPSFRELYTYPLQYRNRPPM